MYAVEIHIKEIMLEDYDEKHKTKTVNWDKDFQRIVYKITHFFVFDVMTEIMQCSEVKKKKIMKSQVL